MTRRTRIALFIAAGIAAFAIVGVGIGLIVAETTRTSTAAPAAATSNPNEIECANVSGAYQSWFIGRLQGAHEFEDVNRVSMQTEMDDQKELLAAVQGYDGQPSKVLATAVAEFGAELALLNAELVIAGKVSEAQSATTAGAHRKVRSEYAAWRSAICG